MKILLDECLPVDFRHHLPDHEVHSAEWAGFKGLKNGELLRKVENAEYDVLLTTDRGIPYQQNLTRRRISIMVIQAPTNQLEDLLPVVGAVLSKLTEIGPGQVAFVSRVG
jgi:predicted nuclease of predicted toxin-antitoxin system